MATAQGAMGMVRVGVEAAMDRWNNTPRKRSDTGKLLPQGTKRTTNNFGMGGLAQVALDSVALDPEVHQRCSRQLRLQLVSKLRKCNHHDTHECIPLLPNQFPNCSGFSNKEYFLHHNPQCLLHDSAAFSNSSDFEELLHGSHRNHWRPPQLTKVRTSEVLELFDLHFLRFVGIPCCG